MGGRRHGPSARLTAGIIFIALAAGGGCSAYDDGLLRAGAGKVNPDSGTDSGSGEDAATMDAGAPANKCAAGECWWSNMAGSCESAGAPTADQRPTPGPDEPANADVGEIYLGWT